MEDKGTNTPEDTPKEAPTSETPPTKTNQPVAAETVEPATDTPTADMQVKIKQGGGVAGILRKPTTWIIVLLLAVVAVGGWLLMREDSATPEVSSNETNVQQEAEVQQLAAAITLVEGAVQYSSDGGETWADATGGETVGELDYIRTLSDGRAVVLLDDGSAIRLDSSSEIYLASSNNQYVEVVLVDGQVYTRVTESDAREFSVTTANDSFVAQGTAYKTSTDGTSDTVEVYQSKVKVESDGTEVEEGNKYDTNTKEKGSLDLDAVEGDEFVQWNKGKDLENDSYKDKLGVLGLEKEEPAPETNNNNNGGGTSTPSASIQLSGSVSGEKLIFNWSLNGTSAPNGFKLVRAKGDSTPTYGQDKSVYIGSSDSRSYKLYLDDGNSYYFRVCIYRPAGSCDTYSNTIQLTAPNIPKEPVVSGGVNLNIDGQNISWSLDGGTAPHGYKVVLSSSPSPVYPNNSIKYTSSTSATLPDKEPGTYYVRVCKYTNGTQDAGCVDYSNEVQYLVE